MLGGPLKDAAYHAVCLRCSTEEAVHMKGLQLREQSNARPPSCRVSSNMRAAMRAGTMEALQSKKGRRQEPICCRKRAVAAPRCQHGR